MTDERPKSRDVGRAFALAQVGMEMVAPIVLGLFLDSQFGWGPWGVVAGAVFGLVGGLSHLVVMLNRFDKQDSTPRQDSQ
jgi:F0F1-type ATP synthase assembly protein I